MTRDELVAICIKEWARGSSAGHSFAHILIETGAVKVEEPKAPRQIAIEVLRYEGYHVPVGIITTIENAGLKIVKK